MKRNAVGLNQLCWPPLRSDCVGVACFSLSTYCIVTTTWPAVAVAGMVVGAFAGLSPRMTGAFGLKAGDTSVGGEFVSPVDSTTRPADPLAPDAPREPPPKTGSGAG